MGLGGLSLYFIVSWQIESISLLFLLRPDMSLGNACHVPASKKTAGVWENGGEEGSLGQSGQRDVHSSRAMTDIRKKSWLLSGWISVYFYFCTLLSSTRCSSYYLEDDISCASAWLSNSFCNRLKMECMFPFFSVDSYASHLKLFSLTLHLRKTFLRKSLKLKRRLFLRKTVASARLTGTAPSTCKTQ